MAINFKTKIVPYKDIAFMYGINKANIDVTGLNGVDISKYYVYHHYKTDSNELFYIGKGVRERAISTENRNIYWHNIVSKHGCSIRIIAQNLTQEEAFSIEKDEIKKYGRLNNETGVLVNMTDGGDGAKGYVWSDEQREQKRQQMSGNKNHQFGIRRFGIDNPNFGNKGDNNSCSKAVLCFTVEGIFVKRYTSIAETEIDGFNNTVVSSCCLNKRSQHKNHIFIFESEYNSETQISYTRGKTSKRKVVGIDHINKLYKIYDCISNTKKDGFSPKLVQQCCAKQKKTHHGKEWYYYDEVNIELLRYSLAIDEN